MDIDNKLKEELHQHTLAMKEQEKLKARLLGESDYFNRIVAMNAEAERRQIAAMIMASMISNDYYAKNLLHSQIAGLAVECADVLIAELNKKKDE